MKRLKEEEIEKLRKLHRELKGRREAYKVNAIILLGTGWELKEVSEALLLHEDSIREYYKRFEEGGEEALLENHYQGKQCRINADELKLLEEELRSRAK